MRLRTTFISTPFAARRCRRAPTCSMTTRSGREELEGLRVSYTRSAAPTAYARDPHAQFAEWFGAALASARAAPACAAWEANAMCLSTVDASTLRPSARMVLLKGADARGFVWYSHYTSRKGGELARAPHAALTFWWPPLERSVRVEGRVERLPPHESDAYFASRPPRSRLGALASTQSQPIESAEALRAKYDALCAAHPDGDVPRPEHWGGYLLRPDHFEFWTGREARLHDRIVYDLDGDTKEWVQKRLQP